MLFDREALQALAAAIHYDDDGPFVWRPFDELSADVHVERHRERASSRIDLETLNGELRAVGNRLRDLETVTWKLAWLHEARCSGTLDRWRWMYFASSDVTAFFTFARSLFDHLSRAIGIAAPHGGSVKSDSFNGLVRWVTKSPPDRVERNLGEALATVVASATWFQAIRSIRDSMLHLDAMTLVFPGTEVEPPEAIGIQLWTRKGQALVEPALLLPDNENIASFERLSVAMLSRIYQLLDDVAEPMRALVGIGVDPHGGSVHHPAFAVIERWTHEALQVST